MGGFFLTGVIIKGIGGFYYIKCDDAVYECKARGKFRKDALVPTVGDRVDINIKNGKGSIEKIHERKNMLIRPAVANVDQMVVVAALRSPDPHGALIDNFLITGSRSGIETVLCFNKADLEHSDELVNVYRNAGYKVVITSVERGEGIDELRGLLFGKVTAFAGNSGVGKSSLLNAIGVSYELETGAVSEKIQRGRHTTRHVELLELDENTYVFDTPGFSSFEVPKMKADELAECFIEFEPYRDLCRFRGCSHTKEAGCAVLEAVGEGKISPLRHESYVAIYEQLKKIKEWEL